jgi:antitoxin component of RelBE/YafQ-DinJ toxin-antitoxin module
MIVEEAYKTKKEDKLKTIYCRVDYTMHRELCTIRNEVGISLSELIRAGARRIIKDAKEKADIKLI